MCCQISSLEQFAWQTSNLLHRYSLGSRWFLKFWGLNVSGKLLNYSRHRKMSTIYYRVSLEPFSWQTSNILHWYPIVVKDHYLFWGHRSNYIPVHLSGHGDIDCSISIEPYACYISALWKLSTPFNFAHRWYTCICFFKKILYF